MERHGARSVPRRNLGILGFLLLCYRVPRVIVVDGLASSPLSLGCTIVAGCPFATTLLKVLLCRPWTVWLKLGRL